jgi:hypothetical protein
MRSFLLKRGKYAELKLDEGKVLMTLIILRGIQREKSKMLLKSNVLHDSLPMKGKVNKILENNKMIYLSWMLKLKIITMKMMMWNYIKPMKSHKEMKMMKKLNPLLERILILQAIKVKGRNILHKQAKERVPYPQEVMKSLIDARFEKFLGLIKNLCLQIPLLDATKIPPYSKYMRDIVTNKNKIPKEAITTMLAGYSLEENYPKRWRS